MGEGRLAVVPDTAELSLGVSLRASEAATAYQQAAAVMAQVVQALLDEGLTRDQIQTGQIELLPIYEQQGLVGYEANATVRVRLRDLTRIGRVIDRAVAAGATVVRGITFDVREPGAYESRALQLAVQHAERQAATLARSLGIGLGSAWQVEAEPAPGPVFPALLRAAPLEAMPVLPGTLELVRRVRVGYLITPP